MALKPPNPPKTPKRRSPRLQKSNPPEPPAQRPPPLASAIYLSPLRPFLYQQAVSRIPAPNRGHPLAGHRHGTSQRRPRRRIHCPRQHPYIPSGERQSKPRVTTMRSPTLTTLSAIRRTNSVWVSPRQPRGSRPSPTDSGAPHIPPRLPLTAKCAKRNAPPQARWIVRPSVA